MKQAAPEEPITGTAIARSQCRERAMSLFDPIPLIGGNTSSFFRNITLQGVCFNMKLWKHETTKLVANVPERLIGNLIE